MTDMKRIGERIKKKRELMNLNLNELAERVAVSASALSQIEKSKSFPSIFTLKAIAEALHTTIGDLVGENESMTNNPVVLKSDIKYVDQNDTGATLFMLSNHDANKQMDTYLLRFAKGSGLDGLLRSTYGQVFCHILSGEIRFDLNEKSYLLKPGDNIYFNAKSTYNALNNYDGISEMLWIQSPPSF
jgi:transcriptional regulator with XRE-family HTH domain